MERILSLHSRCCDAHCEFVFNKKTKEYKLVCEVCGRDIEKSAEVNLNCDNELWEEKIWEYAQRIRQKKR
jgi:hypothetical protein